jgi:hypothetical protein
MMNVETWDTDQAVTRGPWDEELEGRKSVDRYGVTGVEERAGEPLAVALAQEEPTPETFDGIDDQWVLVEDDWDLAERPISDADATGPEEAALHLVVP